MPICCGDVSMMRLLIWGGDNEQTLLDLLNKFAQEHGARKEVWDERLESCYQNKSKREYSASIYGLAFQEFPVAPRLRAKRCISNGASRFRG